MPTDEKDDEVKENEAKPIKKGGVLLKWIIICGVLLGILGGTAAGGLYYFRSIATQTKKPQLPPPVIGTLWPMDPFIVNLRENNGERYLKVILQLEVTQPAVVAELDLLKPKLRDSTLDLLGSKSFQELQDLSGKQKLRDDLMIRLNSFLTSGKIVRVYFTEFVIQ
ncbi:MAG: flagellar basal body-associated FliL family protein [Pseudomonadota bacterium]